MPQARALAALDFVRPDSALDTIERAFVNAVLALPQFPLGLVQMGETLCQVRAILHRERDQERAQGGPLQPDGFPALQVGRESLGAATNRAQGAEQVGFAELGRVELDLVHGEEVPEQQVIATGHYPLGNGFGLLPRQPLHILRYVESAFSCFTVTFNPFG